MTTAASQVLDRVLVLEMVRVTEAAAVGDATRLSLAHGDFATEARLALHRGGWTESIVKLRHLIEPAR